MKRILLLTGALLARPCIAQATRAIAAPDAEHPTVFSSVSGVRELSDGRLVVVDRRERAVLLVDFARRTSERIGREGAGPGEIAQPASLLGLPGDTTAVWDGRNARLFFVDAPGAKGRAAPLTADDGRPMPTNLQAPRFADAMGRLYFIGVPTDDENLPDSIPILRFARRTSRFDTVGLLKRPQGGDRATLGPPGKQVTMNFANPFSPAEAWVVTPDGRVGVVRSPEYRLDWTYPTKVRGHEV
ncbi:MAG: hypothetical protein H7066_02045, partial [Cytophagaceae bacterium]|nr:hypothetical protein [Gemmatimonadaceae bacterium]